MSDKMREALKTDVQRVVDDLYRIGGDGMKYTWAERTRALKAVVVLTSDDALASPQNDAEAVVIIDRDDLADLQGANGNESVLVTVRDGDYPYALPLYTAPPSSRMRRALEAAHFELSALIEFPDDPQTHHWPVSNRADAECLQKAYCELCEALRPGDNHSSKESEGGDKVDSSSVLVSKEEHRHHTNGMTPVGTIAETVDGTGANPSDPTPPDREEIELDRLRTVAWAAQGLLNADTYVSDVPREQAVSLATMKLAQALGTWQMHHGACRTDRIILALRGGE